MQRFVYVQTFGCQMNAYDTERILQVLEPLSYTPTDDPAQADLILLNSCTVRDRAEQKLMSYLGTFAPLKQHNPDLLIGVGGCVAQQEGEALLKKAKYLDLVFGPDNIPSLPALIDRVRSEGQRLSETVLHKKKDGYEFVAGKPLEDGKPVANVTVMKGCNKNCAFCIVPQVRGRELSKPADDVVAEVTRFVESGVREILLLGQNVNSYGHDRSDGVLFPQLLDRVAAVPGLDRLRFTTSHPWDCTDELIDRFATLEPLCEYFHLPVQSGSDRVLERMRRGYTAAEYIERADRIRAVVPGIYFSTDIIVGFPGETEADFEETLSLIDRVKYDFLFGFTYSPRPGTKAAQYEDDVPEPEKARRLQVVFELADRQRRARLATLQDQVVEVLVEGPSRASTALKPQMMGRTRTNVIVNFPVGSMALGQLRWVGQMAQVKVTRVSPHSVTGEVVQIEETTRPRPFLAGLGVSTAA
ncbi:MAG: tRNA (N6-isopentenyl adenosine(37)-C2)-methylthiotransferase MiaB [Myxococcales bacterium]|nr:tRNA (N6-isopentenyl adenosine(37)-C2)-methylthiotransferase MiaB [Myxococcales bacterium]